MLNHSNEGAIALNLTQDVERLKDEISSLPPARRQACALLFAARLVEETAYFTASDGTLPVTTRLMMWAHELERMSNAFAEAACEIRAA